MKKILTTLAVAAGLILAGCDKPTPDSPSTGGDDIETPDTPDNPDNPGTPDNPDNPGTPDNPETPDTTETVTVTVLDPGKTPSGHTYTPQHPEMEHSVACNDFFNPVQDELDEYGNIDYVCTQGNGTAWPMITQDSHIRLYQGTSASKGGSYIRVRSKNGAKILDVTVGSATSTKIAWYQNGRPSTKTATTALAAGGTITAEGIDNCTEICFICMGTSQSERWELNTIAVRYKGGFIESDFYEAEVEYGPLVKVDYPFSENFERGFPTTDKPTYDKYGLTAGRENLQWSTWYGSFSWQKPIEGTQSAQLRVYQEESDYEKDQFGNLKMEFFLKDLSKVSFKYYYSEFWNRATVSYCEFGSTGRKGAQQIALGSYSDRQTVQDFCYVLDEGRKHDAKIIIEIDPGTGFPGSGHYDFYFDSFVFE